MSIASFAGSVKSRQPLDRWWRFSSYVVVVGSHIVPAPDAVLEHYNPWPAASVSTAKHRGGGMLERPYLSLIRLAGKLKPDEWSDPSLILDWCREHGLLGLLFLEALQISLYPRFKADIAGGDPCPTLITYSRTPTGWVEFGDAELTQKVLDLPVKQRPEGELVRSEYWPEGWQPGVLVQEEGTGRYVRREVDEVLGPYFPLVAVSRQKQYEYPLPASPQFWKQYAEGVEPFGRWARHFAELVRAVGRDDAANGGEEPARDKAKWAAAKLEMLAAPSGPAFWERDEAGIRQERRYSASLLGSYASMVLQDAAQGLLNVCEQCDTVFVSSSGRARFCTPRCRRTALQREWRARQANKQNEAGE